MNLVADERVDMGIILALRKSGIEVFSIAEDAPGLDDDDVLKISLARTCFANLQRIKILAN